jgi:ACR3 family arsenite efflux pump ArsB
MQLVLVFLGAVLGLTYGAIYEGFIFSSKICLFAGITMIMPTLFKVKFSDILLVFEYRTLMFKGLLVNYLLIPIIAIIIGLLTNDFGIAAGLFLLSVLSGGGLVMHWIKKTEADTSLGFVLLFINLLFVSLSLLMLHLFGMYGAEFFGETYSDEINVSNFAKAVIILLIVIPFILSRVILFIKPLQNMIEKYQGHLSKFSLFVILFYLFGLQNSQQLFELYDFEINLFYISIIAVIIFYALIYILARLVYNLENSQERAAFWHSITRYLTLALLISTFTTGTFGVSMILPIMFAYIVQLPMAIWLSQSFKK